MFRKFLYCFLLICGFLFFSCQIFSTAQFFSYKTPVFLRFENMVFSDSNQPEPSAYSVRLEMYNADRNNTSNTVSPWFRLHNTGTSEINLAETEIMYYFTGDGDENEYFWCDWSSMGSSNIIGSFGEMPVPMIGADRYLRIQFKNGVNLLQPGEYVEIHSRFAKSDWSDYIQSDDYSFNHNSNEYTEWNRALVYINNTIDSNGDIKIEPQFDNAFDFYEGLAVVYKDGLAGYINQKGEFVIEPQFEYAGGFYKGIASYGIRRDDNPYKPFNFIIGYIDTKGNVVKEPTYKFIQYFYEGLAQVRTDERYGYIDTEFNMVIEEKFVLSGDFHEGLAFAQLNDHEPYGYIDRTGEFVIEPIFYSAGDFKNGYAPVHYRTDSGLLWGSINKKGEFVIPPKYHGVGAYSEGLFGVGIKCEDGVTRFGYIDINENIIIEPVFEEVRPFSEGLAAVKLPDPNNPDQSKWGYINRDGEVVIQPAYDEAKLFKDGIARVHLANYKTGLIKEGYINKSGEYIWEPS